MTPFDGKTIFLHQVPAVLGGDPAKYAVWLKSHGFVTLLVKCAEGPFEFLQQAPDGTWHPNVSRVFVDTLHGQGLKVVGWGFCHGVDPENEGKTAAKISDALGLDGWGFDVEGEYEAYSDAVGRLGKMLGAFRDAVAHRVPLAFISWAYYWNIRTGAQIHKPEMPRFAMTMCDVLMPMVYWNKLGSDGKPVAMSDLEVLAYCSGSADQQKKIMQDIPGKEIVPILRAYTGDAGFMDPGNIVAAGAWARTFYPGASWWFMDTGASTKYPQIDAALAAVLGWGDAVPDPNPDPQPEPQPQPDPQPATEPAIPGPFALLTDPQMGKPWRWPNGKLDAYPATVVLRGGRGNVKLSLLWKAALRLIMTIRQWNATWKKAVGWCNDGQVGSVQEVYFQGGANKVWVTGKNADGFYEIDTYYNTDVPPNLRTQFDQYRRGIMTVQYKHGHDDTGGVINSDLLLPVIVIARDRSEKLRIDPTWLKSLQNVPFGCHVKTSGASLNVRSGPGTKSPVVTTLANGTAVTVFALKKIDLVVWGQITTQGSLPGWVSLQYTDAEL